MQWQVFKLEVSSYGLNSQTHQNKRYFGGKIEEDPTAPNIKTV